MIKNKIKFADGDKGYFVKFCPACGYAMEDCATTRDFTICPVCHRSDKAIKLQLHQITTWPKHSVKPVHLPFGPGRHTFV